MDLIGKKPKKKKSDSQRLDALEARMTTLESALKAQGPPETPGWNMPMPMAPAPGQ